MHMVIRAIVYAENQEEALDQARNIFDSLCERGSFDYFTMFNEEGSIVSGKGRWGDLISVAKVTSPEGKELIDEGWKATVREFNNSMLEIRRALKYLTDEQIMNDKTVDIPNEKEFWGMRYHFHCVGQYEGYQIWLYDNDGSGIRDKNHLDNALNKWPELEHTAEEYKDLDVWVVPADVHH